ncbi:DUF4383 domain-containing protein [Arthrobacter sp. H41]|uniref:DUF4383 domain-containing protein n=1 Tax=Arthrobacter sp. H41 TaxID=1312978 RepID=UPI0004BACF32|nr:DUF4383 domain-containing protein [Arthrobacter sp. H41]
MQFITVVIATGFLCLAVLGFMPSTTTRAEHLELAGHDSATLLFGLFQVSNLHNTVHLLFGIAGIIKARYFKGAHSYLLYGGMIYLVLAIMGVITPRNLPLNFLPLNTADNWLHLGLGATMISLMLILTPPTPTSNRL